MTSPAGRAYGQARARARSADILTASELAGMAAAAAVTWTGWRDLDVVDDGSGPLAVAYARLIGDYRVMRRAYPEAREALDALLQLHELENVKLVWRAAAREAPVETWRAAWRPLGELQRVALDRFTGLCSPTALVAALARTPYGAAAESALRAHGSDVAAVELALDRFGTQSVAAARDRLPAAEQTARTLLQAVIAARGALIDERTRTMVGLEAARAAVPLWSRTRHTGRRPRPVETRAAPPAALARWALALEPFSLAIPLALVLRREEEVRRLVTLSEVRARHAPAAEAARALAAVPAGG
jgi:hypothetical protein